MKFSENNFLYALKQIVVGANTTTSVDAVAGGTVLTGNATAADGGTRVDKQIPLGAVSLVSGTTLVTTSNIQQLSTAAATNPGIAIFNFTVPRDYDEASDNLVIRGCVFSANADATITITGTPIIFVPGTGLGSAGTAVTATAPFSTVAFNVGTKSAVFEISLSGNSLKRDQTVGIILAYVGTTTGADKIQFIETSYDSCIVSYNDTDTAGVDGVLAEYGNPLR